MILASNQQPRNRRQRVVEREFLDFCRTLHSICALPCLQRLLVFLSAIVVDPIHTAPMRTSTASYELQGIDWKAENEFLVDEEHPEFYLTNSMQDRINTLSEHDKLIVQYLAMRKFHIPGNTFWADYWFW